LGSRFGPNEFVVVPEPILTARGDRTSMSYRVESFGDFTRDKLFVLDRYLRSLGDEAKARALRRLASAGILTWAAECVYNLEGASPEFLKWCREAARFDPHSPRLLRLAQQSERFEIDSSNHFLIKPLPQPRTPVEPTVRVDGVLGLDEVRSNPEWRGARVERGATIRVTTVAKRWHYSALIPLLLGDERMAGTWHWAKLNVQVHAGQVGIGLLASDNIFDERLISPEDGRVDVYVKLNRPAAEGVMVRNGSIGGRAVVEIFSATVECSLKSEESK
jgi:hypothetical protein